MPRIGGRVPVCDTTLAAQFIIVRQPSGCGRVQAVERAAAQHCTLAAASTCLQPGRACSCMCLQPVHA
eukprot:365885-Chlamydomonas_euryale.AAC.8